MGNAFSNNMKIAIVSHGEYIMAGQESGDFRKRKLCSVRHNLHAPLAAFQKVVSDPF
jgi:hypothetical protein